MHKDETEVLHGLPCIAGDVSLITVRPRIMALMTLKRNLEAGASIQLLLDSRMNLDDPLVRR